jgi:hypothetical protein
MNRPRNIIVIVADSLRHDTTYQGNPGIPYLLSHGVDFSQARAAGCWTLPATAGMFTGMAPHGHGATSQTRGVRKDVPTLAGLLKDRGYATTQVTANVVTSHIFGLHRGFDEVKRIWMEVPAEHKKIHELLVLAGKPRLRKKIWSRDFVAGRLSEDIEASKVWLQDTFPAVLDAARRALHENEARGVGSFLFLNLMETHFPYHVAPLFETTCEGRLDQFREIVALFHLVNQTWLINDKVVIPEAMLRVFRRRQRLAWERLAPAIDSFARELHEGGDNLVVFCSDHGDAFGEQNWLYHFSNVTDGGNRIPLVYLRPGASEGRQVHVPVSARDLYSTILRDAGVAVEGPSLVDEPERSIPYLESYWYNNQGKTLPRYRLNQNLLIEGGMRYLRRGGLWYAAPPQDSHGEPLFEPLGPGVDPLQELTMDAERRASYRAFFAGYEAFCKKLAA